MSAQTEPISLQSSPLFTFAAMPSISVDISGCHEELLAMRVRDSDTIGNVMAKISARTGVPISDLHLGRMVVHADPDDWSDLASDPDATSEEELDAIPEEVDAASEEVVGLVVASAPDAWEAFYEVDPLSMRPPAGPAPGAPVLGAATAAAVAAVAAAAAAAAAPAPGATTHGAAPDAPVPGAASQQAATSSQQPVEIIRQGTIP